MWCPICNTKMKEHIGRVPVHHVVPLEKLGKSARSKKTNYSRYWECSQCNKMFAIVKILKEVKIA